jgi:multidrug resistance protein
MEYLLNSYQVTWDGPDDPANPKNWTRKRKWVATLVVSSFTFISPVSSSMVAPAIQSISSEFNITNTVEQQLLLSVFVLAYAIGPLFLGPLSEIYGRIPVLQLANLVYLVFNTACGASQNKGEMIAFRFLSGLGGSAPLAIGGGLLSDAWSADERGAAISIYSLAPLLGPAIGPIAGGFITQNTTWRWTFYATSIADALIQLSGLFFLQETYAPKILHVKAKKLRKETGNKDLHTEFEHPERSLSSVLKVSLTRPFRLLGTQQIVQVLALYMAYLYGIMYLVLSTFPTLWTTYYGESVGISGLNYISLGVGFFLGTQICAPLNDKIYKKLKTRNNHVGRPEFRIPLMLPGSLMVPTGLFIYGWTANFHTHWIFPNIGTAIFAAGNIICFQCIQTYLVDSYTRFAASAVGAATVLRSLAGFGFPLFAPYMYDALGYGWGNSVLGFIALGIGLPAPILLWSFGQRLRERSPFAAGGGN